ncbi:MAG: polysaccharide biosynthesis protein [Lachnospiraceae bacterium]|nr:polysaccharide biosynthesis protein [Lachnospiraceae bacterium]
MSKNKKSSVLVQGAILAAASILCRVIGLLYRSPLREIIGDDGNGFYSYAYNIYTIILLIASFSIPLAVSKSISARLAKGEYRNAQRIFHGALFYAFVVGLIAFAVCYFGAPYLVPSGAVPALHVLAPVIFFSGILGVLRGYFQGHSTMIPTSISQIIEQILNAVVSVVAAYLMVRSFTDVSTDALKYQRASLGAKGSAIGTGAGVGIGLIFCIVLYFMYRPKAKKQIKRDKTKHVESYGSVLKILIFTITPVIFSTAIYNCSTSINQSIFSFILGNKGYKELAIASMYGIFSTQFNVLINVPVSMASALSSAIVPDISGNYAIGEKAALRESIDSAIKLNMMVMIPCAVGLTVLADPIIHLLFPTATDLGGKLLIMGSVTVVFYGLSTLSNGILQGLGKMNVPVKHAFIAVVVQAITLFPLLYFTQLNTYALVIAMIVFSFIMCVLNARAITKYVGYKQEYSRTFLRPFIASVFMGIAAFAVYKVAHMITRHFGVYLGNALAVMIAIIIAVLVYMVGVVKTGAVTEDEMRAMPKGYLLVKLCKKLHLM